MKAKQCVDMKRESGKIITGHGNTMRERERAETLCRVCCCDAIKAKEEEGGRESGTVKGVSKKSTN